MKDEFSNIFRNLTNFKKEAVQRFDKKNLTGDQEVKIFASLGQVMDKIGKKAKSLHKKFEENKAKLCKEDFKAIGEKFEEMQKKFNEIFRMGEEKKEGN